MIKSLSVFLILCGLLFLTSQHQSKASLVHVDRYFTNLITPLELKLKERKALLHKISELKKEIAVVEQLLLMVKRLKATPTRARIVALLEALLKRLRAELAALLKKSQSLFGTVIKRHKYLESLRSAVRDAQKQLRSLRKQVRLPCKKRSRCFVPSTPIKMADGSYKRIDSIKIGDLTAGGKVTATMQFNAANLQLYMYADVLVAGGHTVNHQGQWMKVRDAVKNGVASAQFSRVYDFNTEEHKIYAGRQGALFADYQEIESSERIEQMELEILNKEQQ